MLLTTCNKSTWAYKLRAAAGKTAPPPGWTLRSRCKHSEVKVKELGNIYFKWKNLCWKGFVYTEKYAKTTVNIFRIWSVQREEVRRGSCVAETARSYRGCVQKYIQYLVPFQKLGTKKKRWGNVFLLPILSYRSLIPMGKKVFFSCCLCFSIPKAQVIKQAMAGSS